MLLLISLTQTVFAVIDPDFSEVTSEQDSRVRTLLSNRCFVCHGPDANHREGGFRLDDRDSYTSPADSGVPPIIPGDPQASPLWQRIVSEDASEQMPPPEHGQPLTEQERQWIAEWIEQGAELPPHWSFIAPHRPSPPTSDSDPGTPHSASASIAYSWTHPIDRFVLEQQLRRGFQPSPEATRSELLRRVSLDLIGLPPTPAEVEQFENDRQPGAYERQVDRLLTAPGFGEHWARKWLDLARYADSAGYADDPDRTIWAYRDWVIRALNENAPIDQFTIDQIAGDLLPQPTTDQLVATAFHRNTLTNNEGGTNDEEFRNVAVVDRVNTTMSVWMGVTMGCAQCHTHKYDPFTHEEYFQLFAIFNQTEDADRKDEIPTIDLFSESQINQLAAWKDRRLSLELTLHQTASVLANLVQWASDSDPSEWRSVLSVDASIPARDHDRGVLHPDSASRPLANYFAHWLLRDVRETLHERDRLKQQAESLQPETTVPVMSQRSRDQQRKTHVHLRGDYRSLGPEVGSGTPAVFPPLNQSNSAEGPNRLDLAHWLVDPGNPLTARVWVNRIWEALFGIGIVRTSEEFGAQGELPSHPELLDWMACELIALDWDFKQMLRTVVTSQTYRQSSKATRAMLEQDPDNVWLARGPRVRLAAEMVRDSALFSSGLLAQTMYGPPVLPPQPSSGLKAAFGSATDWTASEGQDRYRRGIYTKWRRSNPYPSMATFDAPSREVCVLRRDRTNTPLQALVTLNDPAFVEAAQALARRVVLQSPQTGDRPTTSKPIQSAGSDSPGAASYPLDSEIDAVDEARLRRAFQLCTARQPETAEVSVLLELLAAARKHMQDRHSDALQLATEPFGALPPGADAVELAAWTSVCNVLLNLDEVLMKR
jgi:hypothetical protein